MKITIEDTKTSDLEVVIKGDASSEKVRTLIDLLSSAGNDKVSKSLIGRKDEREYVLSVIEVECFESDTNGTVARHNRQSYKVRTKLFEAEQMYAGYGFRRISKSTILNLNHIRYIEIEFSGNYQVVTTGDQKMTISRRYIADVKKYIKEEM